MVGEAAISAAPFSSVDTRSSGRSCSVGWGLAMEIVPGYGARGEKWPGENRRVPHAEISGAVGVVFVRSIRKCAESFCACSVVI